MHWGEDTSEAKGAACLRLQPVQATHQGGDDHWGQPQSQPTVHTQFLKVILRAIPMNILMAILMFTFTAIPMAFISDFPLPPPRSPFQLGPLTIIPPGKRVSPLSPNFISETSLAVSPRFNWRQLEQQVEDFSFNFPSFATCRISWLSLFDKFLTFAICCNSILFRIHFQI